MTSQYPEQKPQDLAPVRKFVFSLDAAKGAKEDLGLQLEAAEQRLQAIIDKCAVTMNGQPFPLIDKILTLTHDPDELKVLAKGLERVASFIADLDDLQQKAKILELIDKDPSWLTWAFGDFEDEIEKGLQSLESTTTEE